MPDGARGAQMAIRSAALIRPPYKLVHDTAAGKQTLFDLNDREIGPGQAGAGDTTVSELYQRLKDAVPLGAK